MINVLFVANIIVVFLLITVILFQKSEGGVLGIGGGGKGALFTARGAGSIMTKITYWLGGIFFVICMVLAFLVAREGGQVQSFMELMAQRTAPLAAPAPAEAADRPEVPVN